MEDGQDCQMTNVKEVTTISTWHYSFNFLVLCQNDTEGLTNPQDKEFERLQGFASVPFQIFLLTKKNKKVQKFFKNFAKTFIKSQMVKIKMYLS